MAKGRHFNNAMTYELAWPSTYYVWYAPFSGLFSAPLTRFTGLLYSSFVLCVARTLSPQDTTSHHLACLSQRL
jgi:hypothetical protein